MDVIRDKIKRLEKDVDDIDYKLNKQGDRLDKVEGDIIGQKKDTIHLQDAIKSLQTSIDKLILGIEDLKYKPLRRYEKVIMIIISAMVGMAVTLILKGVSM